MGNNLTEEHITANADTVDWHYVSNNIDIRHFSDDFFEDFRNELIWEDIDCVAHNKGHLTTGFFNKFSKYMDNKSWYKDGLLHRLDGPATIWTDGSGLREFYKEGMRHNEKGPAITEGEREEWWLDNINYSKEDFVKKLAKNK